MAAPLDVTVGPDGSLRETRGRPMVVIFNSKQEEIARSSAAKAQSNRKVEPPSLQFVIHCQHDRQRKSKSNTRVRRHVMQRYWRQQRVDASKEPASPTVLQHHERSRDWAAELEGSFLASLPPYQPRGFWSMATTYMSQYSMPVRQRMLQLANHFSVVGQIVFSSDQEYKAAVGTALSDPALFHMHLLTAAIHQNFSNNSSDIQELLFHQTKAIELVNSQVINQPNEIKDTLMSAVAYLAVTEWYLGDFAAWEHHFNGLAQMVGLRGGLARLDKSLRTKVFMQVALVAGANFVAHTEIDYPIKFHYWDDLGRSTANVPAEFGVGEKRLRAEQIMAYFPAEPELLAFLRFRQLFFTRPKEQFR